MELKNRNYTNYIIVNLSFFTVRPLAKLTLVVVKAIITQIKNTSIGGNRVTMYIVSDLHGLLAIVNFQSTIAFVVIPISEVEYFAKVRIHD